MVVASAAMPWWGPRRRPRDRRGDSLRNVRRTLDRIERDGCSELERAQLVCQVRRLLVRGPWDGPPSSA